MTEIWPTVSGNTASCVVAACTTAVVGTKTPSGGCRLQAAHCKDKTGDRLAHGTNNSRERRLIPDRYAG